MLAAFSGWNDACQAATNAIHQLIDAYDAREVRHISCEGYYDYQVSRPTLCRVNGHARIVWPQTTFYDIPLSPTRHCLVMLAPEPNYRWREYCRESLHIAEELGVNRIITLGSMVRRLRSYQASPHRRVRRYGLQQRMRLRRIQWPRRHHHHSGGHG